MNRRASDRHQRAAWLLTLLLAVWGFAACGGGYRVRPITLQESAALQVAAHPLVRMVGLGPCTLGVTLNDVPSRALEELPGSAPDFCLGFNVTSSTLSLPPEELRALIAHGLAHLMLEHSSTVASSSGGTRARARGFTQPRTYTAEEETAADRQAATLLAAAVGDEACGGLVKVLERAAAEAERWTDWTNQHPLKSARANAARGFCGEKR